MPKALHSVYADVLGVPALLDTLPDPTDGHSTEGDPAPEAATRRPVHPENARNGRGGRAYA